MRQLLLLQLLWLFSLPTWAGQCQLQNDSTKAVVNVDQGQSALPLQKGLNRLRLQCRQLTQPVVLQIRALALRHPQLHLADQLQTPQINHRLAYALPAGDSDGVLRLSTPLARPLTFRVVSWPHYRADNVRHNAVMFLYLGVVLALSCYNLLLWLRLRERQFGYYSLYTLAMAWFFATQEGIPLLLTGHTTWLLPSLPLAAATVVGGTLFFSHFMALHKHYPRSWRYLILLPTWLMAAFGLATSITVYGQRYINMTMSLVSLWLLMMLLLYALLRTFQGNRDGRWTALAIALLLGGMLTRQQTPEGGNFLTYYGLIIAALIEAVLVAYMAARRLQVIHNERQQALLQARTDPLTGVLNRQGWLQAVEALADIKPSQWQGVYFIDLNAFKAVNDRYGHHAGDQALIALADVLSELLGNDDILGRYAGDEFVIYSRHAKEALQQLATHLQQQLASIAVPASPSFTISASVGAHIQQGADSLDALLQAADASMYQQKSAVSAY
ncbi:diguanylate cyclase domain-containing protein [Gallaecimonas sp. GXIMD1310]|uniref:GGDEF domain-containing protein n=1 Tax=Gallaecimonas sp. GXIMD1310 TaxID=3131926 RepID=UPI0032436AB9